MDRIRVGALGAARITPRALVAPARRSEEVDVVAVAARDPARARAYARKHGIPRVHDTYEALLADPDVDAVYNPLPNGLHGRFTLAALGSGKHVLCEKPFAANAAEAEQVAAAARASGLVVMEAFHWRYHPLARRMIEVVRSGEIGELRHVEARMCFPLPSRKDIRYQLALGGGATMDAGCYTIHIVRTLVGAEPEVVAARALCASPGVDRAMTAELAFPGGVTGRITTSMWSRTLLALSARAVGTHGELRVLNPVAPQYVHRFVVRTPAGRRRERFTRRSTYAFQLDAFAAAVLRGEPFPTDVDDAVANMRVIDAVYTAAGLEPRPSLPA